ncbi:MAG: SDR family oxidoreductase [Caulobacterales bacterium]|nr:SDR family oxidoreductase [Caulobacterales bacterium]
MTEADMADDRVVIVTGGARGIGLATARRFSDDGCRAVIADVNDDAGAAAADECGAREGRATFVRCDVSERLDVHNLVAETLAAFSRLDVLVNNAGIAATGDILELDDADFERVLRVNLRGPFIAGQAAARQMIAQIEAAEDRMETARRRYAIVNMSSINAEVALPEQLAYAASKGGLNQLTQAMALSLIGRGVRVNAVGPGSVKTDMMRAIGKDSKAEAAFLSRTPIGRFADPDEIADVVAFLASPNARYITGQCIYVDGGRLALNTVVD